MSNASSTPTGRQGWWWRPLRPNSNASGMTIPAFLIPEVVIAGTIIAGLSGLDRQDWWIYVLAPVMFVFPMLLFANIILQIRRDSRIGNRPQEVD